MSNGQINIAIDAMGGENSPYKVLKGVEIFCKKINDAKITLFGSKTEILSCINKKNIFIKNHNIVDTSENVRDDDSASIILRARKNSSIYKGLEYVKNNSNSGFVSAGNTAAIMILSRYHIGMIQGIDRPAICSLIPNQNSYSVMLDLGANVTVTPENLLQFAIMGYSYYKILNKDIKPRIGILNIGTEDNKGLEFLRDASDLISKSFLKDFYIGFIEPNKITSGNCDIIVSDGYTGNIMLKSAEGISNFITSNLRNIFSNSIKNKLAYKIMEKDLKVFKDNINPDIYNGANLIGLNGTSIKSHGSATPIAFSHAIEKCYDSIKNNLNQQIINSIDNL